MGKDNTYKIIAVLFIIVSALVLVPSIIFIVLHYDLNIISYIDSTMFLGLLENPIDQKYPIFLIVTTILTVLFLLMCKFRKNIFKSSKSLIRFIVIIGFIYAIMLPTSSLDIYTYIARGRMQIKYHENPYYTSTTDIINKAPEDKIMYNVAINWWDEKATYGPYWELIVKFYYFFSGNSIFTAIYVYKVMALLLFIISVFLIKKITNNDLHVMLFGLNPYVLYQFLANAHNDLYVIFFVLLAIYFFKAKKSKKLSIASLGIATSIKYYSVLFVPFLIFYFIKDEKKIKDKIARLLLYGTEYLAIVLFPYAFYAKDINVFLNPFIQQGKYNHSLRGIIFLIFNSKVADLAGKIILVLFVIYYFYLFIKDFWVKKCITWKEIMTDLIKITIFFILGVMTCYNSWYIGWIIPFMLFEDMQKNRIFAYWELSSMLYDYQIYNGNLSKLQGSQLNIVVLYLILTLFILGDFAYQYVKKR